jgi:hypothetical protein
MQARITKFKVKADVLEQKLNTYIEKEARKRGVIPDELMEVWR